MKYASGFIWKLGIILQFASSGLTKFDEIIGYCWCPMVMRWLLWLQQWSHHCDVIDYRNWYQYWGHCCLINDLGSSPQPEGEARGLWWASQVVNDWLIDISFPRNVHTYTSIVHTDKKEEFHLYPNINVPLGGHQRNYIEFIEAGSLQVGFNMVRT